MNPNQAEGIRKMEIWKDTPNSPVFILSGVSGAGKTYTLKKFIEKIPPGRIVLTAPTTEALENLAEDLPEYSAMTIHKLLGFRPTETSDERQILVRAGARKDKKGNWVDPPPKIVNYDYIVLEEGYYCPGKMIDSIMENYRDKKWIILGDYKQLPPVDEAHSRLLDYEDRVAFKHDLPDDMRSTCPIQKELVAVTRQTGLSTDFSSHMHTKSQAIRKLLSVYDGTPENFSFVGLAYENRVVDKLAKDIREMIYNYDSSTPPQPGELIRVSAVVDDEGFEIVRANEKVKIIQYNPDIIVVKRKNGEEVCLDLDINNELEELYQVACLSRQPSDWRVYHHRVRKYVQIKSAFCSTIHSIQGKTEDWSIIVLDSMLRCRSDNLAYVAVGRSRNTPWFVHTW